MTNKESRVVKSYVSTMHDLRTPSGLMTPVAYCNLHMKEQTHTVRLDDDTGVMGVLEPGNRSVASKRAKKMWLEDILWIEPLVVGEDPDMPSLSDLPRLILEAFPEKPLPNGLLVPSDTSPVERIQEIRDDWKSMSTTCYQFCNWNEAWPTIIDHLIALFDKVEKVHVIDMAMDERFGVDELPMNGLCLMDFTSFDDGPMDDFLSLFDRPVFSEVYKEKYYSTLPGSVMISVGEYTTELPDVVAKNKYKIQEWGE